MKVGDVCTIERRYEWRPTSTPPQHSWTAEVTKVTPKRVYVGNSWFAIDDTDRELRPKYLDYQTRVVAVADGDGAGRRGR